MVIIFITYQIFGGILSLLITGTDIQSIENINLARIIISFSQFIFILLPVIILNKLRGDSFSHTFRTGSPKLSSLFLSIIGILVIQPAVQAYMFLQTKALQHLPFGSGIINSIKELMDKLESYTLNIVTANSFAEFLLVVFIIAVTPAICEEFFFRGLIMRNIEKNARAGIAIFLTGLIFAIFHFHPFNLIPLILLGYYLGYTVYYTNSISTGIILHFINNFISAFFIYKYGRENFDNPHESVSDNIYLLISGFLSLIIFYFILKKIKSIRQHENNKIIVNV